MLTTALVCLCTLWGVSTAQQQLDLYEGDICKQSQGTLWTCKLMRECPQANEGLSNNKRPQLCNFVGTQPVVCCEPEQKTVERAAKSKQMCKKYAESVYISLPSFIGDGVEKTDTCALVEPLITNGKNAEPREYPHMAQIGYGDKNAIKWLCGGSLISERYILSSAHCTDVGDKGPARWARLGDYNVKSKTDDQTGLAQSVEYEIVDRIKHPEYRSPSDICKQSQGTLWTCKLMRECPQANEGLSNNKRPQLCNFVGTQPVVCCEPEQKTVERAAKSKQMCKKYAESVYISLPSFIGDGVEKTDTCALVEPLITNGKNAEPREYPHMAQIGYGDKNAIKWLCGGSLISERYILSSAHCTDVGDKGPARWARLGDYNVKSKTDDQTGLAQSVEYEIVDRIKHPEYRSPSVYNDIALYKLSQAVEFNEYIRPICLQSDHQLSNTYVISTGWGRIEWGGEKHDILQKVNVTITPRKQCSEAFERAIGEKLSSGIIDASQLCAGDIDNGGDICQVDAGGPLQLRLKDPYCMYSQVAIYSFGTRRCGGNKPGVYTRVSHYVPWIESIVWP